MDILFDKNRFYLGEDGANPLAEITFTRPEEGVILVDHTYSHPDLRGQGIARKLVEQVAAYARQEGLKVRATCSYAQKVLSEDSFSDIYLI